MDVEEFTWDLAKLELRPNDALVVKVSGKLSDTQRAKLGDQLQQMSVRLPIPLGRTILMEDGTDISTVSEEAEELRDSLAAALDTLKELVDAVNMATPADEALENLVGSAAETEATLRVILSSYRGSEELVPSESTSPGAEEGTQVAARKAGVNREQRKAAKLEQARLMAEEETGHGRRPTAV